MEMIDALSEETALATIRNPKNRRRRVWTATILLNRMGINRGPVSYEKWSKANRLKARTILDALWKKGLIVRAVSPDTRNKYLAPHEIAYKRVEDAPQTVHRGVLLLRAHCVLAFEDRADRRVIVNRLQERR